MNVVQFPRVQEPLPQGWQSGELTKLTNACAASIPSGDVSGWEVGTTEYGDPQLYLLGPAPDHDCILSISRLGRLYVLEDGKGQVLFENDNLMLLAEQTCSALRRKKAEIRRSADGVLVRGARVLRGEGRAGARRADGSHHPFRAAFRRAGVGVRNHHSAGRFAARALPSARVRSIFDERFERQTWTARMILDPRPKRRRAALHGPPGSPPRRSARCRNGIWPISIPASNSPELKRDLEWTEAECVAFEKAYKGNLEKLATSPTAAASLPRRCRRYEKIDDVAGRLSSYAGLLHAGNAADPVLSKFYGDMQERITAAYLHLLFFTLELNRIDDAVLDKAMADPALGHYRPWLEDIRQRQALPARRPRRAVVPGKVDDRLFRVQPAVRRDHGRPALQGRRQDA